MVLHSQSLHISLAHRYWHFGWSQERNVSMYGASASSEGVGSNLKLELTAVVNSSARAPDLSPQLAGLKARLDHRCLWTDVAEFATKPSTLEAITAFVADHVDHTRIVRCRVWENDRLACTWDLLKNQASLQVKLGNLTLTIAGAVDPESGILSPRPLWAEAIHKVAPEFADADPAGEALWAERVLKALQDYVPGVTGVRIDLGRQRALRVGITSCGAMA